MKELISEKHKKINGFIASHINMRSQRFLHRVVYALSGKGRQGRDNELN